MSSGSCASTRIPADRRPGRGQTTRAYPLPAIVADVAHTEGTINDSTRDIPFHKRHDDELPILDVAEILMTPINTGALVAPDRHRTGVLQDRPATLHDSRRPAPFHREQRLAAKPVLAGPKAV